MKVHLLLLYLFGILNAFALSDKHEEEGMESSDSGFRPSLESRIWNGKEAEQNEFPWMVAIRKTGWPHWCGGALISLSHVLTCAHCFWWVPSKNKTTYRKRVKTIYVVLGDHYNNITEPEEQSFNITDLRMLKRDYRKGIGLPHVRDVAVLKMDGTATPSCYVSPISLPNPPIALSPGDQLLIAGWGFPRFSSYDAEYVVNFHEFPSNVLRVAPMKVIQNKDCVNILDVFFNEDDTTRNLKNSAFEFAREADEDVVCSVEYIGQGHISPGDSGSPVVYYDETTKRWVVVGICSYAFGRVGERGNTNVSYYLKEIEWMMTDLDKKQEKNDTKS